MVAPVRDRSECPFCKQGWNTALNAASSTVANSGLGNVHVHKMTNMRIHAKLAACGSRKCYKNQWFFNSFAITSCQTACDRKRNVQKTIGFKAFLAFLRRGLRAQSGRFWAGQVGLRAGFGRFWAVLGPGWAVSNFNRFNRFYDR